MKRGVAAQLRALHARFETRIHTYVVAVPGTVTGTWLVQAPNLGWQDVELSALRPRWATANVLLAGNDATFAGIAEYRRGAAAGTGTAVHL